MELPVLQEHLTEVAPHLGEVWVKLHGLAKMGQGPGRVARQAQGVAEVVTGHGEVRLQAQRGAELSRSGLGLPLFQEGQAEVVGRLGVVGLQSQRGATAVDGPVHLAQHAVDQGQIGMVGSGGRIEGDGTPDPFGRPNRIALLIGDHAEQVQCVGVVWLSGQDATIRLGRLVQEAALVLLDGQCQLVRHGKTPWCFNLLIAFWSAVASRRTPKS